MACSKYEYVKKFEQVQTALPQTYIVVRIDGRSFTKFCQTHQFQKPNDLRAIKLMNKTAQNVCQTFKQIFLAYGQSDEYSFAFNINTTLFSRRTDKILTCLVSTFSSAYVFYWNQFFQTKLKQIPTFDGRVVIYPNQKCLKDYFRWRQVDCHINNLYNTIFWCMVKSGKSNTQVENFLKDTNSGQKNQILFTEFNINYNKLEQIYRRGTFICYKYVQKQLKNQTIKNGQQLIIKQEEKLQLQTKQVNQIKQKIQNLKISKPKLKKKLVQIHQDCIKQQFWQSILTK